ncbi:MAG: pirin family protein [Cellvibrionaceae bacterium]|nr:pirin family protein [Cellvibrionaceae bacterium]
MFYYRPAEQRGSTQLGWLNSHHSFSFADYYDENHLGFSKLLVINDDYVTAGAGFGRHGHRDMEIISYVLEGAIEHRDTLGNQFVVSAGEVQRMTAGSGVLHSEYNASSTDPLRFLQIWILPNQRALSPSYQQQKIEQHSALTPLVSPINAQVDNTLTLHQDASIARLALEPGQTISLDVGNRSGYLHVYQGEGKADFYDLADGDGLGIRGGELSITAGLGGLTGLWFDLPPL